MIWLLPRFTPSVVYILLWRLLLDPTDYGLLNRLRATLGAAPVDLLTQHLWSVIVLVNGLTGASLGLVIFTAAIESIPRDLLRAARVDGATTAPFMPPRCGRCMLTTTPLHFRRLAMAAR